MPGFYFRLPSMSTRVYGFFPLNIEPGQTARRLGTLIPNPKAKLRDQVQEVCRFKYFSPRGGGQLWSGENLPG